MVDSYRRINYSLRLAKSIERKMVAEAIRRLSVFGNLASYRYIGFGSVYFSDFILFHKAIGFTNMVSIEKDKPSNLQHKNRFEFNKPYGGIELMFGDSWGILHSLQWNDTRTVLWLDYDGKLDQNCLSDISTFFTRAEPGSFLLISYNIMDDFGEGDKTTPLERLEAQVGKENVPPGISPEDSLTGWARAEVFRTVVSNKIEEVLKQRNGVLRPENRLRYRQIVNFRYQDGAMMATVGGVLFDAGQEGVCCQAGFHNLEFYSGDDKAFKIEVPCLTTREIRHLDSLIPISECDYSKIAIPAADVRAYQKLYRYFPTFAEADL